MAEGTDGGGQVESFRMTVNVCRPCRVGSLAGNTGDKHCMRLYGSCTMREPPIVSLKELKSLLQAADFTTLVP